MRRAFAVLLLLLPTLAFGQIREGTVDDAIRSFTAVLEDRSSSAEARRVARNNRGTFYIHAGRFDEAIADYTVLIEAGQADAPVYMMRGTARGRKGDRDGALADFEHALKLNPQYAEAYYNRGKLRASLGEANEAIADLTNALRLKPAFPAAAIVLANILGERGEAARALEVLNASIAAEDDPWARVSRAGLLLRQNRKDEALEDYSRALERAPGITIARMDRANLRMMRGEFDRAIADFTAAIDSGEAPDDAWFYRGAARLGAGAIADAKADLERFAAAHPEDKYAAIMRFIVSARAGVNADAGLRPFLAAAPSEWPGPVIHFLGQKITRDELLAQIGDDKQRIAEGHYYLGQECLIRKDIACARKHFETSVATGLTTYVEHQGATAELRRLPVN